MSLTAEEYEAYLKFDQLNMNQFLSLLEGPQFFDFLKISTQTKKYPLSEMAQSSIRSGNIQGNGSKDETMFAAPLYNWLEWAIGKQLKLPQALQDAYQKRKLENESCKSFRPPNEAKDKFAAVAVMKVIMEFVPELPVEKLVDLKPIREVVGKYYTKETLVTWANNAGIHNVPGRPTKERQKICLQKIPKQWGFSWD